jgi:hypothetical protein
MLRFTAKFISVVFHPLLMLTYMLVLLLLVNPYLFGVNSLSEHKPLILKVFIATFFLPAFSAFLMQRIGFVTSLEMPDRSERTGPFIATGIFYLWVFRSVLNDTTVPTAFLVAVLGATLVLFICFFINIFFKISIHSAAVGGFVGMVLITVWLFSYDTFSLKLPLIGWVQFSVNFLLLASLLIAGLVGTARLLLNAHTSKQVYLGFAVGLLCQFIALKILI